jgi:cytochrome c-type biogenesis protein CcmH
VKLLRLLVALVLLAAVSRVAFANESAAGKKDPVRAITSQLICPCSCGEILSGCTCDTGKAMQGFVSDQLRAGKGKQEITAALVAKYGEVILGAPKPQGFNLVVWIAPFLATVLGFVIAALVLKRWVRRRAVAPSPALVGGAGLRPAAVSTAERDLEALRARAEAELRKLQE